MRRRTRLCIQAELLIILSTFGMRSRCSLRAGLLFDSRIRQHALLVFILHVHHLRA